MLYKTLLRPILFQFDPEFVHEQVLHSGIVLQHLPGGLSCLSGLYGTAGSTRLRQELFGYTFSNPVGLAAGFDKNILLPSVMQSLGFGYEEAGSVSARPWPGNPKPRLFRLPEDRAIINRMGLNNQGIPELLPRLQTLPEDWPVGISVVKTPDPAILDDQALEDFATALKMIHGLGAYVSINISCPNTSEGKTFEEPDALETLLAYMRTAEKECIVDLSRLPRPWLLKISPDLPEGQLQEIFEVACRYDIAGWVACNTTSSRTGLKTPPQSVEKLGRGGLSGRPLQSLSTRVLGQLYQLCRQQRPQMVLIGVGGIHDTDSAWEKITHGASLIQLYTALVYEGPDLLHEIIRGLVKKLDKHGFDTIGDAVGSALH